ncbi:hypothetical protein [Francisella sp. SYW-9]|uniref:hypothetical protein n=1 Tax=Francisella sp. SYW-9 TaxID=2610888 RepID=UPI00123D1CCB|nr:hypothetical protein [Francisella sp. SYW-9]
MSALKAATLKGIDSFIELYKIQNNRNYLSTTLGNLVQNFYEQGVHTNEITSTEVEKANRIRAILNRDSDDNLKKFFRSFGERLKEIQENKCKRCFITTHYSFITLYIFHHALVINKALSYTENFSDYYINIGSLLLYYLTPDTRHKQVILNLYGVVENALRHIEENLIKEDTIELDQASLNNVTDTDRLLAIICRSNIGNLKSDAISILGEESFQKYKNLGQKIVASKLNNTKKANTGHITQGSDDNLVESLKEKSTFVLESISNISRGILSYTLKFEQNTADPNIGKNTREKYVDAKNIQTILAEVPKGSSKSVSLKPFSISPEIISQLAANIGAVTAKIAFQSKGYGVVNRHGITGQIRAFLLKEYISMFSIFIKNHYYHILSLRNETDQKNMRSDMIKVIDLFIKSYMYAIQVLPNKDNEGSLYFHLHIFANPANGFKEDRKKMEKWNKSKLGKFYKD